MSRAHLRAKKQAAPSRGRLLLLLRSHEAAIERLDLGDAGVARVAGAAGVRVCAVDFKVTEDSMTPDAPVPVVLNRK